MVDISSEGIKEGFWEEQRTVEDERLKRNQLDEDDAWTVLKEQVHGP